MSVEYIVELYAPDANWGPGTKLCELSGVRNLGWSQYDRMAAKGFFTLSQNDPDLQYFVRNKTHVKITRVSSGNTTVYAGQVVDYRSNVDDVVFALVDYIGLLALSRCGYRTMYPTKLLGTEIVSPEFALAKAEANSILGFITAGTIEDPLANDGVTAIKTDNQFGLLDQSRLRLFYDLSEMGRANTDNHVTFGITRDAPYTFSFLKNQGVSRSFALDLNGRVVDYEHTPNWTHYRNDLATLAQDSSGGATEVIAKDDTAAANEGRRQDIFSVSTLLGLAGSTIPADQQAAAAYRMLSRGLNPPPSLSLKIREGSLDPFVDANVGDKAQVEIVRGIDNIHSLYRLMGFQCFYSDAGEQLVVLPVP